MDFRFQISDWKAWPLLRIRCSRLLVALCALCFCVSLHAADVTVSASLTESTTEAGQPVQLQIKISGARNATPPERIDVRGLDINYSGQSTQVQMNNFNVTMSVVHSYTVVAQRAGSFVIPSLEVAVDGKKLTTNPVTLNVGTSAAGAGGASNARLAFSELVVPKQTAYVGEAIPVEFRIFVDARIRWQTNEQPTIPGEGFTIQKLAAPTQNQTQRDGRQYDLVTFKTAITPVKTGRLTLGPAEIHCVAQLPRQRQPHLGGIDDLFNDPFGAFAQTQQMTIKSDPVEFEVKPLPAGQPASFSGAVGQFTLAAQASPTKVKAGDPITVTLKVAGRGNFDRVNAPQMVAENGWRSYPPSAKFQPDDDIGISGAKTFEMAVIPDDKKTTLPEIEFSYFDPVPEKYVTRHSDRLPINVEAGSVPPVAKATPEPASQPARTPQTARNADDIQYIRTDAEKSGGVVRADLSEPDFLDRASRADAGPAGLHRFSGATGAAQ